MRRALPILVIACSGQIAIPRWNDPPPRPCNSDHGWTWSNDGGLTEPTSITAFDSGDQLVLRLTQSSDACAELNAGADGDFVDVAIDGAGAACAACTQGSCTDFYQGSALHFTHGISHSPLVVAWRFVGITCDPTFVRAAVQLPAMADGGAGGYFMMATPMCRPSNDCTNP